MTDDIYDAIKRGDRLLRPADVARIYDVHPKTVSRWAKLGRLKSCLTPGRQRRFLESDVRAFFEAGNHG